MEDGLNWKIRMHGCFLQFHCVYWLYLTPFSHAGYFSYFTLANARHFTSQCVKYVGEGVIAIRCLNDLSVTLFFLYFTLSNARRFYSSMHVESLHWGINMPKRMHKPYHLIAMAKALNNKVGHFPVRFHSNRLLFTMLLW